MCAVGMVPPVRNGVFSWRGVTAGVTAVPSARVVSLRRRLGRLRGCRALEGDGALVVGWFGMASIGATELRGGGLPPWRGGGGLVTAPGFGGVRTGVPGVAPGGGQHAQGLLYRSVGR